MKIILGSSSPTRKEVFTDAGYVFDVISPDINEKAIRTNIPYELPKIIASAKMDALSLKINYPAIIITADQVVVCDNHLHEKAQSEDEARLFFERYSKHPLETVSAICVMNTENGKRSEGVDIAKIYLRKIPKDIIEKYITTRRPFKHAGGFMLEQELLDPYIEKIDGTNDSIKGLPLTLLKNLIKDVS